MPRIDDCSICTTLWTPGGPDEAFYDAVLGEPGAGRLNRVLGVDGVCRIPAGHSGQ